MSPFFSRFFGCFAVARAVRKRDGFREGVRCFFDLFLEIIAILLPYFLKRYVVMRGNNDCIRYSLDSVLFNKVLQYLGGEEASYAAYKFAFELSRCDTCTSDLWGERPNVPNISRIDFSELSAGLGKVYLKEYLAVQGVPDDKIDGVIKKIGKLKFDVLLEVVTRRDIVNFLGEESGKFGKYDVLLYFNCRGCIQCDSLNDISCKGLENFIRNNNGIIVGKFREGEVISDKNAKFITDYNKGYIGSLSFKGKDCFDNLEDLVINNCLKSGIVVRDIDRKKSAKLRDSQSFQLSNDEDMENDFPIHL